MSTKTTFKRIALVAVAALGLGVLSVAPSNAAVFNETLTISSATATAYVGDTATATLTHLFGATKISAAADADSSTVRYTCTAPIGASCPPINAWQTATSDTANVMVKAVATPTYVDISSNGYTDSATSTSGTAKSTINIKATGFTKAGSYVYSFYSTRSGVNDFGVSGTSAPSWTVTVSAGNVTATTLANKYISTDTAGYTAYTNRLNYRGSSDSSVVCAAGSATTPAYCATAFILLANSAGDTKTTVGTADAWVQDTVTVTITGAGLINSTGSTSSGSTSATMNVGNGANGFYTGETLTILSNGTAGTGTITFTSSANVTLGTQTVTFTGVAAAAYPYFANAATGGDTVVSLTGTPVISAVVKDSAGNVLKKGTLYLYSSDTKVAGNALSTSTAQKVTTNTCTPATEGVSSVFTCAAAGLVVTDTGTATFVLRDSWTVAASTWASAGIELTVTGDVVAGLTVAFDKATYAPGERAVITLTATDIAARKLAYGATGTLTRVIETPSFSHVSTASISGTNADTNWSTKFAGLGDSGIETRVVTMPTVGGAVSYAVTFAKFGSTTGELTTVTASATVADPTKDAADAATDAALEATDAAYAAQDAAQLAAEAADAATAAAEAATAAVEDLATQVASLFADLQKQITTLANVVAKIAKKVKA